MSLGSGLYSTRQAGQNRRRGLGRMAGQAYDMGVSLAGTGTQQASGLGPQYRPNSFKPVSGVRLLSRLGDTNTQRDRMIDDMQAVGDAQYNDPTAVYQRNMQQNQLGQDMFNNQANRQMDFYKTNLGMMSDEAGRGITMRGQDMSAETARANTAENAIYHQGMLGNRGQGNIDTQNYRNQQLRAAWMTQRGQLIENYNGARDAGERQSYIDQINGIDSQIRSLDPASPPAVRQMDGLGGIPAPPASSMPQQNSLGPQTQAAPAPIRQPMPMSQPIPTLQPTPTPTPQPQTMLGPQPTPTPTPAPVATLGPQAAPMAAPQPVAANPVWQGPANGLGPKPLPYVSASELTKFLEDADWPDYGIKDVLNDPAKRQRMIEQYWNENGTQYTQRTL